MNQAPRPRLAVLALVTAVLVTAVLVTAVLVMACGAPVKEDEPELLVFAAASLRDVAAELGEAFEAREVAAGHGAVEVVLNVAGSNTLAQQIAAAPRAEVFLSADVRWVDFLEAAGRTVPDTRTPFLGNRLVVVVRDDAEIVLENVADLADLEALGARHLAVADPAGVPAGRYTRAFFEGVDAGGGNLWDAVSSHLAPTPNVRAALALVESDPEVIGVVYRTDALSSPRVRILLELPPRADVPIESWAVVVDGTGNGGETRKSGRRFVELLTTPEGRTIAERHGFLPPPSSVDGSGGLP